MSPFLSLSVRNSAESAETRSARLLVCRPLTKRGIYVTTDLYVSRPVQIDTLLPDFEAGRRNSMNAFKVLAVIHEQAFDNWKAFSKNLLTQVNPYTGRAYKDDPGLAWLSLINEGNLGNYLNLVREIPGFRTAWNDWLIERYQDRSGLSAVWGQILARRRGSPTGHGAIGGEYIRPGSSKSGCDLLSGRRGTRLQTRARSPGTPAAVGTSLSLDFSIGRFRFPNTTTRVRTATGAWAESSLARWGPCRIGVRSGDSPTATIAKTCFGPVGWTISTW